MSVPRTILVGILALVALPASAAASSLLEVRVEATVLDLPVRAGAAADRSLAPTVHAEVAGAPLVRVGAAPAEAPAATAASGAPAVAGIGGPSGAVAAAGLAATAAFHLALFAAAPLYSRIGKGEVLRNPVRGRVFEYVRDHPGTTVTGLVEALGIGWGTATHHLDRLERTGYVTSQEGRGTRLLFAAGAVPREARAALAATQGTAGRIAAYVAEHPGARQADIAAAMGLQAPAVSKHLTRLVKEGILRAERAWRSVAYRPAGPAGW